MNRHPLLDLLAQPPAPDTGATPEPAIAGPGPFAVQGRLPAGSLSIEVDGLGPLLGPLPPEQAEVLHQLSEPAPFGWREQTLLDPAVRHSGEIDADLLGLDWGSGVFAALQQEVARALGVEQLQAWLHNLLIYGPGQFFKPHQDTEKHPRMVATLVLVWPSAHIGGELRVRLGQEEVRLASQQLHGDQIRWFAFYADCRHEVLPVEDGWRVALTFDLVLPEAAMHPESPVPTALQQSLQAVLHRQFALDTPTPALDPWLLMLDHEYTEHGLRWHLLKGADRPRVAALRAAALALSLNVHLALAELHQSWSAESGGYAHHRRYDDDDADDTPEPEELLDESLTLDFWVDDQGAVIPNTSLSVNTDDVLAFIDTGPAHLVRKEYEGYMGNYGDTLDYWYRRAALVIQTPQGAERTRFEVEFDAALADARALARDPAQAEGLAARIAAARRSLSYQCSSQDRELLVAYADIAAALPEETAALALMRGFSRTGFLPEDAAVLARLEQRRGTPWMRRLLQAWIEESVRRPMWQSHWSTSVRAISAPRLWPASLPAFTQACLDAGLSPALLDDWFTAHQTALASLEQAQTQSSPVSRQNLRDEQIGAACQLAEAIRLLPDGDAHLRALIEQVSRQPALYPSTSLAPFVLAAGPLASHWPQHQPLRQRVLTALQEALAEPERASGDHRLHSIEWTCRCQDCTSMIAWAESTRAEPLVLAMAEQRRQHVQDKLDATGAPISTTTLRKGSPYKLVLGKPGLDELLARECTLRDGWARDLAQLRN